MVDLFHSENDLKKAYLTILKIFQQFLKRLSESDQRKI